MANNKKLLLSIDVGTSSIKFSITDSNLKEYFYNSIKYEYSTINKYWTEINPMLWTEIIKKELKKIFKLPYSNQIVAICPTAQMHTLVFLDENGLSVRKAILWNDQRTKNSIENLKKDLNEKLNLKLNADIMSTGSPLASLLWVKNEEKNNFKKISKICMCKDYINYFLTGKIVTDYCDASTSCLMDLEKEIWSEEICNFYNINKNILPDIYESTEMIGTVKKELADELGILNEIKTFVGTGDNAATIVATKYLENSKLTISLGTSGVVLTENKKLSIVGKNIIFKYANQTTFISQTSLSAGGKSLDWWFNDILKVEDYNNEQNFSRNEIKKNNVFFLPYLSGEKYLYKNPYLSGVFYNLTLQNDRRDLNISVLEGVTFVLKSLYLNSKTTDYQVEKLTLLGGGSKSDSWAEIIANIFDLKVVRYSKSVEAVHGAAIIGFIGLDESISLSQGPQKENESKEDLVFHYKQKYDDFCYLSDEINKINLSNKN